VVLPINLGIQGAKPEDFNQLGPSATRGEAFESQVELAAMQGASLSLFRKVRDSIVEESNPELLSPETANEIEPDLEVPITEPISRGAAIVYC